MKLLTKLSRLSLKKRFAISILMFWVLYWNYAGWAEYEYLLGFAIGGFPVFVLLVWWAQSRKKKSSDSEEYVQLSKYVRTQQRRKYERLVYPPTNRPLLKFGEYKFEIIDISERGLKLFNDKKIEFDRLIHGEAVLLSGKRIIVDGEVSWSLNNEFGLLIHSISKSIISKEKRIISSCFNEGERSDDRIERSNSIKSR
jgi:hypothetical protein